MQYTILVEEKELVSFLSTISTPKFTTPKNRRRVHGIHVHSRCSPSSISRAPRNEPGRECFASTVDTLRKAQKRNWREKLFFKVTSLRITGHESEDIPTRLLSRNALAPNLELSKNWRNAGQGHHLPRSWLGDAPQRPRAGWPHRRGYLSGGFRPKARASRPFPGP